MFTVACVLKGGGPYDADYVWRLAAGVRRHTSAPIMFTCLTDTVLTADSGGGVDAVVPLTHNLSGWWSKMELFRLPGPLLYFDLDTVIVGSLDPLITAIPKTPGLVAHSGFKLRTLATGIMGWHTSHQWIWDAFAEDIADGHRFFSQPHALRLWSKSGNHRGDQEWLAGLNERCPFQITHVQDLIRGVYSYKWHIRKDGQLPEDAAIVCFHGTPRPHELRPQPEWMASA